MRKKMTGNQRLSKKIMIAILASTLVFGGMTYGMDSVVYAAGKLTVSEKREFKKYLNDGMGDNGRFMTKETGLIYESKFFFYDVNNDGHKDLIVTGALGLRSMTFTEVYLHAGKKYIAIPYNGTLVGVHKNGMKFLTEDYGMAGAVRYTDVEVYRMNAKGKSTQKLAKNQTVMWYDEEKDIEYPDGKILELKYKVNGKISSSKDYVRAMKKYKFSKVKWHTVNKKNINKYVK